MHGTRGLSYIILFLNNDLLIVAYTRLKSVKIGGKILWWWETCGVMWHHKNKISVDLYAFSKRVPCCFIYNFDTYRFPV